MKHEFCQGQVEKKGTANFCVRCGKFVPTSSIVPDDKPVMAPGLVGLEPSHTPLDTTEAVVETEEMKVQTTDQKVADFVETAQTTVTAKVKKNASK